MGHGHKGEEKMRKAKVGVVGKVAFAVFSVLLCADAHAAEHNWTLIKEKLYPKSRWKVDFYVDAETVKRKGDTVWLDALDDIKQPDGKIESHVSHYEFRCKTNKFRYSAELYKNISMARGAPTARLPVSEFLKFEPDGPAATVSEYACRRQ
jgi:hypothetical protein